MLIRCEVLTHLLHVRKLGALRFLMQSSASLCVIEAVVAASSGQRLRPAMPAIVFPGLGSRLTLFGEVTVLNLNICCSRIHLLVHFDHFTVGTREIGLSRKTGGTLLVLCMLELVLLINAPGVIERRSNVRTGIQSLICRLVIDAELRLLYLAFLTICNLPLYLPKHHRKAAQTILVSKLVLLPEPILVLIQGLLPLARVRAMRHVGRIRYHVK